jgi:RNA-dependent RNA polymerase
VKTIHANTSTASTSRRVRLRFSDCDRAHRSGYSCRPRFSSKAEGLAELYGQSEFGCQARHLADLQDGNKKTYESQKVLGKLFRIVCSGRPICMVAHPQVQPDPSFRPSDIRALKYPTDVRITRFAVFGSVIDRLKPIKARYEADLQYDLRR